MIDFIKNEILKDDVYLNNKYLSEKQLKLILKKEDKMCKILLPINPRNFK